MACHLYDHRWLEESRRIRGKGLTQLHLLNNSVIDRTFFVPPVCGSRRIAWRTDRGQEPSRPSQSRSSPAPGESAARCPRIGRARSRLDNSGTPARRQGHDRRAGATNANSDWPTRNRQSRERPDLRSWPQLARHVEQLRALEGTWAFASLEIDGTFNAARHVEASRILIDGDRFRTESPEATYEGIFNINVEAQPHEIDIEFVEGPEAGNWNFGIFRLDGDQLEICLDMNGKPRPTEFRTSSGSGHAYETLTRASHSRPANVTGGTPQVSEDLSSSTTHDCTGFEFVESSTLKQLQGEWTAVKIVRDGKELPALMLSTGLRTTKQNRVKIAFGGQLMIDALVRIDESTEPISVDYHNLCGPAKGTVQSGIMRWLGDDAYFNMAAPGQPRPSDFDCPVGSGRTLSQWRPKA